MSNIPIVQGTAVPAADEKTFGSYHHSNQQQHQQEQYGGGSSNSGGGGDYVSAPTENEPFNNTNNYHNQYQEQQQQEPKQFRDVFWAMAFACHLIGMICVISYNLASGNAAAAADNGGNGDSNNDGSISGLLFLVGVCGLAAVGIGSLTLNLMMRHPKEMIKVSLFFTVGMSLLVAISGFMAGQIFFGCLGLFSFAIGICYAKMVWPRIPFAAANLNTALTAVKANMGLAVVAYGMMVVAMGWTVLWFVGVGSALATSNTGILFLLLLSYYWTHQVLSNTVHVTTAGTVGTW